MSASVNAGTDAGGGADLDNARRRTWVSAPTGTWRPTTRGPVIGQLSTDQIIR
jgi:hypothetical protein